MANTHPPGPKDWLFGMRLVNRIKADSLGFYTDLHRDYGDVAYMRLGPHHDYTFFHPDHIKELLIPQAKNFIRMPRQLNVLRQWNGDGILITEGETWLRLRRLLQPAFHQKRFGGYAAAVEAAGRERLDSWAHGGAAFELN